MACSPCEQKRREREAAAKALREGKQAGPSITINMTNGCGYTVSQLTKWKIVLDCAYSNEQILESVNMNEELYGLYIGIIEHSINEINEPECKYQNELNNLLQIIHVLVALGC
jgi:hypothetical protein